MSKFKVRIEFNLRIVIFGCYKMIIMLIYNVKYYMCNIRFVNNSVNINERVKIGMLLLWIVWRE